MSKTNSPVTPEAQGASGVVVDREKIKEWLKHDLGAAISCLNAIYSDPPMLDSLAEFMYGRFSNAKAEK